jgi:hypothetical protein
MPRKPTWKPATTTKITRLPPNGPKPGQSVDAWLHGKTKAHERLVDNPRTPFTDIN